MNWILRAVLILALAAHAGAQPPSGPRRIPPPDIQRGDRVIVEVWSGAVLLKFEAEAQSTGHVGESIIIRNPDNGRRFIARVEEKGKVSIKK